VTIYWLGLDGWLLFDLAIVKFIIPQAIYWSTFIIFVIQVIGLFIPRVTNIVDQADEKEFPVKRIKEIMFFMLFNIFHVLILVGGKDVPIQYVFMFVQIFTFFQLSAQCRLYNSLLSSMFTILTCI